MNESLSRILLIFLSVDALALFVLLIFKIRKEWKRKKIRHYGDRAEETVRRTLEEEFPGSVVLNDVLLKTHRGTTQIDHILICKWGVFVIETKSHNGTIRMEKKEWVQIYGDKVVRFHSPLLQNESHIRAVKAVLHTYRALRNLPVQGIVVFTSQKLRFTGRRDGVIRLREISPYIKSGGKTLSHRALLTAAPGRSYLSRQKILQIEKALKKGSVKSANVKRRHEKKMKTLDRRSL